MRDGTPEPALQRKHGSLLTIKSGGWVILLAVIILLGMVLVQVIPRMMDKDGPLLRGDGEHVASYGFDLTTCLVPRDLIAATGLPKGGMAAMVGPLMMAGDGVVELNKMMRGKYLVPTDMVIGVAIDGDARAYPLRVLNWHEIVNDVVGGVPIAVTYSPLCDSTVVFDRRVGDETLDFGFSGLLYNSNLLLFDRRPEGKGESLWSQLQFRAVAGPAAETERTLTVLPAAVVQWGEWLARYPDTQVIKPGMKFIERYKRQPYTSYYGSEELRFDVKPLPPADGPDRKAEVIAVFDETTDSYEVFKVAELMAKANETPGGIVALPESGVRFACRAEPASSFAEALSSGAGVASVRAFWFAWYAMHPESEIMPIAKSAAAE